MNAIYMIVMGRVQGVGFRYFVKNTAETLGVRGWVKNCPDGTVEIIARGEPVQLEQLQKKCHEGPAHSQVVNVHVKNLENCEAYSSFDIVS